MQKQKKASGELNPERESEILRDLGVEPGMIQYLMLQKFKNDIYHEKWAD